MQSIPIHWRGDVAVLTIPGHRSIIGARALLAVVGVVVSRNPRMLLVDLAARRVLDAYCLGALCYLAETFARRGVVFGLINANPVVHRQLGSSDLHRWLRPGTTTSAPRAPLDESQAA